MSDTIFNITNREREALQISAQDLGEAEHPLDQLLINVMFDCLKCKNIKRIRFQK